MAKAGDLYCNWRALDDLENIPAKIAAIVFLRHRITCHASKRIFTSLSLLSVLFFFIFLFVLRAIFFPGEQIIFEFGIIQVSVESILSGLNFSLLVVVICGVVILFNVITPLKDLMFCIEKLGASAEVSYIFMAAMQQIADLKKSAVTIMESQSARGIETEGNVLVRSKAFLPVLGPVILSSIAATEERTITMETRAFYAPAKNTHIYWLAPMTNTEKTAAIFLVVAMITAIVLKVVL